jgi:phospholipase/carboxylesterase
MPQVYAAGRISACPTPPTQAPPSAGEHAIPLAHGREALLFVPARLARPGSLLVMLHGAGGRPGQALSAVRGVAARQGVLVLAPLARAGTWDVIRGGFGPDVALLNETWPGPSIGFRSSARRSAGFPTARPTLFRSGWGMATSSATCWPFRPASLPRA